MYIICFISVVNRTYQVLLCIQHVLFQQSIGHTRYYYVYNIFYFSSQQDILGTIMYITCFISVVILGIIMYITCFISVVNRTYQVLLCIQHMFYFSSQQDILGTIMYITCFISVVNRTYYVLLCIQHVLFQQSIGHTRYYYVHNMFYFSSQQDILCTIMYITCFISVVNRTYQVLLCI